MDRKQKIVKRFQKILQKYPLSYLIFGSIGRGHYHHNSDIDSLIVFEDKNIDLFLSDKFVKQLPFDYLPDNLFDETDRNDLINQKIDFLRIKGSSGGEKIEFQFFPFSTAKRINQLVQTTFTGGIKKSDNDYKINDPIQLRETKNFNGKIEFFEKRPKLAQNKQRIDFSEIGTHYYNGRWICGISTKKFLTPKVLVDNISFKDLLDNHLLRIIILLIDAQKPEMVDYHILFTLLSPKHKFGKKEEKTLSKRFNKQIYSIKKTLKKFN